MRVRGHSQCSYWVALRKESVDRNTWQTHPMLPPARSLSARRAWIEMALYSPASISCRSLSARRAWIEIPRVYTSLNPKYVALRKESVDRNRSGGCQQQVALVALRKESVDRNMPGIVHARCVKSRSPQGERG